MTAIRGIKCVDIEDKSDYLYGQDDGNKNILFTASIKECDGKRDNIVIRLDLKQAIRLRDWLNRFIENAT